MRQDCVQFARRFGVTAGALAASAFLAACGGGSAGDPPKQGGTAQTITFASPGNQRMGTAASALVATSSSGLPVTLSGSTDNICKVSGTTLTLVAPGTCVITATQAGDATYAPAEGIAVTFTVNPAPVAQTITFTQIPDQAVGTPAPALAATASSGLPVSYSSSTPAVCTASGVSTSLTLVAGGTCTIVATQAGNALYAAAPSVSNTFNVAGLQAQTITFPSPGNQVLGTTPAALAATASSGLAVSYVSNSTSVCTVSGSTLTLANTGTCSITASQAGDASHAAATDVTQTFTVAAAAVPTLTFSSGFATGNLTVEGGTFGGYSGSDLDGWNCSGGPSWCGSGGTFTDTVTADQSNFYYYYQTPTPAGGEYMGIFMRAPGLNTAVSTSADTAGLQLGSQTVMKFNLGMNPEWFASTTHNVGILLTLGKHYAGCNIQLLTVFAPTSKDTTAYSIPLNSFVFKQDCGAGLTVAQALAGQPVSVIDIQGDGGSATLPAVNGLSSGANASVANTATPPVYPTTLVVSGAVTFQ